MAGQKIVIRINSKSREEAARLQKDKSQGLFTDLYKTYDGIRAPNSASATKLSKDLNRLSHLYLLDERGYYRDNMPDIRIKGINSADKNKRYIQTMLANNDPAVADKLEGLCQDVANSVIMGFLKNFSLKVGEEEKPYLIAKGKLSQSLVKVGEKEFRLDYSDMLYFFQDHSGTPYYKNSKGEIQAFPLEYLSEMGESGKNIRLLPNGLARIVHPDGKTVSDENGNPFEFLPLMKTQVSASLSLDKDNESTVDLQYAFETFTDHLQYNGPKGLEAPGLTSIKNTSDVAGEALVVESRFLGLNTKKTVAALDFLIDYASTFTNSDKNALIKTIQEFRLAKNKYPYDEAEIYRAFFAIWKSDNIPKTGFLDRLKDVFGEGHEKNKARLAERIHAWEKVIMTCPYKKRVEYLEKMREDISKLKKTSSLWGRVKYLFTGTLSDAPLAIKEVPPTVKVRENIPTMASLNPSNKEREEYKVKSENLMAKTQLQTKKMRKAERKQKTQIFSKKKKEEQKFEPNKWSPEKIDAEDLRKGTGPKNH